jgi:hypothetical protein
MHWSAVPMFVSWQPGPWHPYDDIAVVIAAVLVSGFFYWLRGSEPFVYGCFEIVVGVAVLSFVFVPPSHALLITAPTAVESYLARTVGLMAGIYIIVRGLDNMDRDLPPSWRPLWDRLFPKKRK